MIQLKVKKLYPDAQLPSQKNTEDAGLDVYVYHIEDCGNFLKVYTGIAVQPEPGYYITLVPRSSTHKMGLMMYNSIGIIDAPYTGEVIGIFHKTKDFNGIHGHPKVGDRLMQLVPQRQIWTSVVEVKELVSTERGESGFGSSGV